MSIHLGGALGSMPEVPQDLAAYRLAIVASAQSLTPHIGTQTLSKYHIALCILQNRAILDPFVDRAVTDQILNSVNGIYSSIIASDKTDPRMQAVFDIMCNAPGV